MQTPKTRYCICLDDFVCSGPQCRDGNHNGHKLHGFPTDCTGCVCSPASPAPAALPAAARPVAPALAAPAPATQTARAEPGALRTIQPDTSGAAKEDGKLRIIYIKSYKVASTTTATIFQRIAEERGLRAATRYNSGLPLYPRSHDSFQIIYGHNFYDMGSPAGYPCSVKMMQGKWTYCGGYQYWMDHYVAGAHHMVMLAKPLSRIASMYYYEAGYTKQKGVPMLLCALAFRARSAQRHQLAASTHVRRQPRVVDTAVPLCLHIRAPARAAATRTFT